MLRWYSATCAAVALVAGAIACGDGSSAANDRTPSPGDGGRGGDPGGGHESSGAAGELGADRARIPNLPGLASARADSKLVLPQLDLPESHAWLGDPNAWQPLPGQDFPDDRCTFWAGEPDHLRFPDLAWNACGPACEKADVLHGIANNALNVGLSNSTRDGGGLYLRFTQALWETKSHVWGKSRYAVSADRVVRLADGRTVTALMQIQNVEEERSWCSSGRHGHLGHAASYVIDLAENVQSNGEILEMGGIWNIATQRWRFALPWAPPALDSKCRPRTLEDGGRTLYFCRKSVHLTPEVGSSQVAVLEDLEGTPWTLPFRAGSTLGDKAIWSEIDPRANRTRIRGWSAEAGIQGIIEIPLPTCAVGIGSDSIAGFSTEGCGSDYPNGRFWFTERKGDGSIGEVQIGPVLHEGQRMFDSSNLKTWGPYLSMVWAKRQYVDRNDRARLLLVRTTDWTVRELRAPEGLEVWDSGLDDDYLYVIYSHTNMSHPHVWGLGYFDHIYRYRLDDFDSLGSPVPTGPIP